MTAEWSGALGQVSYQTYAHGSDGGTPLLLLHAVGTSSHLWEEVLPSLLPATDRTIVVPDLLGHGRSGDPCRDLTLPDHADAMAGLMEQLGFERFAVAGTSMGALIALDLAARCPDRVSALTLNGCPGWHLESQRMARFTQMASKLDRAGLPRPDAPLGGTVTQQAPATIDRRRRDLLRCGRWFISSWWAIAAFDPIARLDTIRCPPHVVMGEHDFHLATSYALVQGQAIGRMTVLPGAGHLSPFDDPRAVATAITSTIDHPVPGTVAQLA